MEFQSPLTGLSFLFEPAMDRIAMVSTSFQSPLTGLSFLFKALDLFDEFVVAFQSPLTGLSFLFLQAENALLRKKSFNPL